MTPSIIFISPFKPFIISCSHTNIKFIITTLNFGIMKTKIQNIKADLYNVFVMGNANNLQMARVYFLLTIPALTVLFAIGKF
jgi:hypothetical protein